MLKNIWNKVVDTVLKLINHYGEVLKKYGFIIPVVAVVACYGVAVTVEAANLLTAIAHSSQAWYIVVICLGLAVLVAGAVYLVLNFKSNEIAIHDLVLMCLAALALLMIIMFCFAPGAGFIGALKWSVAAVCLVASVTVSVFRANYTKK